MPRCPWCQGPVTLVDRVSAVNSDEHAAQRSRLALERITRALYGPGRHDYDRVLEARRVIQELAPELAGVFPNGNGKHE